jgi:UDPglucose 6-dehydrogenase
MMQREKQTDWLADLIEEYAKDKKIMILGKTFKPETNITTGSPSILLKNILEERGHTVIAWDPYVDKHELEKKEEAQVYFIGTKHPEFPRYDFVEGSVVLDPWRYIPDKEGVEVVRIGEGLLYGQRK